MNIILIYFSRKYKGNWDKIYEALENKEKVTLKEIKETEEWLSQQSHRVITILDVDYPKKLKQAYKPPFVMWLNGDEKLLDSNIVNVSGNSLDDRVMRLIDRDLPELTKNYVLLNAGFKGVEVYLNQNVSKYINVTAEGLKTDKIKGLDLSEYPPGTHASADTYRARNRIIAALSQMLVLFSSDKDGKINNLITNYLNLGKEIYCYPGDGGDNDGNSELVKQGATLITQVKDISN